jgi:hypothetical protein
LCSGLDLPIRLNLQLDLDCSEHADDSVLAGRMLMPGCAYPCTIIMINEVWPLSRIPSWRSRLPSMNASCAAQWAIVGAHI